MAYIGGAWRPGDSYFPTAQAAAAPIATLAQLGGQNQYSPNVLLGQTYQSAGGG